jgi:hypothetical protein
MHILLIKLEREKISWTIYLITTMSDYSVKIGIKADTGIMPQALVSFRKYMPPPLPYFNVNICPFGVEHIFIICIGTIICILKAYFTFERR